MSVHFQSDKHTWGTPDHVFKWAEQNILKNFYEIDVAASAENTKCPIFITEEQNALECEWRASRAWCNPPYGRMLLPFIQKAVEELQSGRLGSITFLVPARTDTKWFNLAVQYAAKVIFIKGRIRFEGADSSAPFPSCFIHMTSDAYRIDDCSTRFGAELK